MVFFYNYFQVDSILNVKVKKTHCILNTIVFGSTVRTQPEDRTQEVRTQMTGYCT